jgi:hypothetical protein
LEKERPAAMFVRHIVFAFDFLPLQTMQLYLI